MNKNAVDDPYSEQDSALASTDQDQNPSIGIKREQIFWVGVAVFVLSALIFGATVLIIIAAILVFSPIWLPIAVISSPLLFITSPIWISGAFLLACFVFSTVASATFAFAIFAFFLLPEKYLPSDSKASATFLRLRDRATVALVKVQAKIVLYAAGVGPLADVVLVALERIDLQQLQDFVSNRDWEDVVRTIQSTDPKEIPGMIVSLVKSVLGM